MVVARTSLFTMITEFNKHTNFSVLKYKQKTNTFYFSSFVLQKTFCRIFGSIFLSLDDNPFIHFLLFFFFHYYLFRLLYVLFIHLSFLSIFHSFTSFSTATVNLREISKIWAPRFFHISAVLVYI